MKPSLFLFSAALGLIAASTPVSAQMIYTVGDLILGFQATAGDGSGATYVYNLGAGTGFRDGTTTGQIANLKTDLDLIFGPGWYARTDVYWGIAGTRDAAASGPNTVVAGDPRATIYISAAAATPGTSAPWVLSSGSAVISAASDIASMQWGFITLNGEAIPTPETQRTPTPASNGRGTSQGTGDINSWNKFNPVGGAAFGSILTGGVQAALGTGNPLSHLDLYRLIGRASAAATPNTPVGQGLLLGTFSINAAGAVTYAVPSVTPPSGYDTWADSFTLAGADRALDADPDGDGIDNGAEFVIGGNPRLGTDGDKIPTLTAPVAGFVDFVFRRTAASAYLTSRAEYDVDLLGTWTPAVNGTGGVTVTETPNGFGTGVDRVTVRIPAAGAALFARLRVLP